MKSIAISLTSIWEQLLFFVISMILSTSCNCFSDEMPNFEILHQKTRSDITNTGIEIIIKTYGLNKCTSIWPIRCFFGSLHSFSKKKSPATHFRSNTSAFRIKSNSFFNQIMNWFFCNNIVINYFLSDTGFMRKNVCSICNFFFIYLFFSFLYFFAFRFFCCDSISSLSGFGINWLCFQFTSLLLVFLFLHFPSIFHEKLWKKNFLRITSVHKWMHISAFWVKLF